MLQKGYLYKLCMHKCTQYICIHTIKNACIDAYTHTCMQVLISACKLKINLTCFLAPFYKCQMNGQMVDICLDLIRETLLLLIFWPFTSNMESWGKHCWVTLKENRKAKPIIFYQGINFLNESWILYSCDSV